MRNEKWDMEFTPLSVATVRQAGMWRRRCESYSAQFYELHLAVIG